MTAIYGRGADFREGDAREVPADVAADSVALALLDPPHHRAAEPLFAWAAKWSARVLISGGSTILYTGHVRIGHDIQIFENAGLKFWWPLSMPLSPTRKLPGIFVVIGHLPVLWFVKGRRRTDAQRLMPDTLRSVRDKSQHLWGQGTAGVPQLIEYLTKPGELVAEPFAGTGGWARITIAAGRRWVGADIEVGGSTNILAGGKLIATRKRKTSRLVHERHKLLGETS